MCVNEIGKDVTDIEVTILGQIVIALVDSGSDVSLIRGDVWEFIGKPNIVRDPTTFVGVGGQEVRSRGYFWCPIKIQNDIFDVKLNVYTNSTKYKIVIGKDLLRSGKADIHYTADGLKIEKRRVSDSASDPIVCATANKVSEVNEEFAMMQINDETATDLNVNPKYRSEVRRLIDEYKPAQKVDTKITTKIILTDETPVYERARRLAPLERKVLGKQIEEWLRDENIRPSNSDFASAVVMVKKSVEITVCVLTIDD